MIEASTVVCFMVEKLGLNCIVVAVIKPPQIPHVSVVERSVVFDLRHDVKWTPRATGFL